MTLENLLKVFNLNLIFHVIILNNKEKFREEYNYLTTDEILDDLREKSLLNKEVLSIKVDINYMNEIVLFIKI